jgi:hypothetical protein
MALLWQGMGISSGSDDRLQWVEKRLIAQIDSDGSKRPDAVIKSSQFSWLSQRTRKKEALSKCIA